MPVPQASEAFYKALQRYQLLLLVAGRRQWARMLPENFDGAWAQIAPTLVTLTTAAQLAAATEATRYVPAVLDEQGLDRPAEVRIKPEAFAGAAADGRPLDTLLEGAVRYAKARVAAGVEPTQALRAGGTWLDGTLRTVVTDAGRDATTAEMIARPNVGWVRMVNPPCCSRCAVLAGKFYKFSQGFLRHPRCDCVHIPTSENRAGEYVTDPQLLVDRGLVTDLSGAQRQRIDDGADLVKVLNESRDRWRARMTLERKNARWANYTPEERRRAERRAAARKAKQDALPGPQAGATVHDFLDYLTKDVEARGGAKARGNWLIRNGIAD